jgi:hypothetical protein
MKREHKHRLALVQAKGTQDIIIVHCDDDEQYLHAKQSYSQSEILAGGCWRWDKSDDARNDWIPLTDSRRRVWIDLTAVRSKHIMMMMNSE